jgi:hypothetical protein
MSGTGGRPDVEVSGSFRAAEVTFHEVSGLRVRTTPEEAGDEGDHVRENLPEDPSAGEVYRNVHVRRRVGARLGADVAEGGTHGD